MKSDDHPKIAQKMNDPIQKCTVFSAYRGKISSSPISLPKWNSNCIILAWFGHISPSLNMCQIFALLNLTGDQTLLLPKAIFLATLIKKYFLENCWKIFVWQLSWKRKFWQLYWKNIFWQLIEKHFIWEIFFCHLC